jgi:misacylated tRNA(Ala) deacylase
MLMNAGLYLADAYKRSFEAHVIEVDSGRVALDRTAFCPGEGGQMPDRGWLRWSDGATNVAKAYADAGVFWHYLKKGNALPPVGTTITGELDWTYRHRMMRTHTALHLVNAIAFYLGGARCVTSQVLSSGLRLQFKAECWSPLLAADIERRVNEAIAADIPVLTYALTREEARETPLLNQTKIALLPRWMNAVRVVEIEGIALDFDTGTHVRSTREIGGIQVNHGKTLDGLHEQVEVRLLADPCFRTIWPNSKPAANAKNRRVLH